MSLELQIIKLKRHKFAQVLHLKYPQQKQKRRTYAAQTELSHVNLR